LQQIASKCRFFRPALAYAWMAHYKMNIACPAIILFIAGWFFLNLDLFYSISTRATPSYTVDAKILANLQLTAVVTNYSSRDIMGLIIVEGLSANKLRVHL
jgi:hypothetical protein